MYDNEDEIKQKRRKLLIIAIASVLVFIILIIILISRSGSSKKNRTPVTGELTCELEVSEGIQPGPDGIYNQAIEVVFKSANPISNDYPIIKKTIGTADNIRNTETFRIFKTGIYRLNGYVQDAAGNKGTCSIEVEVSLSHPECELEVSRGTLGDNNWYVTNVEVSFKSITTNSSSTSIAKYYILEESIDQPTEEITRTDFPSENIEKVEIEKNGESKLVGYIIDSSGTEGRCEIVVKKDAIPPTCALSVENGTLNNVGQYTSNVVVGISSTNDDISGVSQTGIGINKNYNEQKYTVTAEGMTMVYGYVKDNAGNEGRCSLNISRPITQTSTPKPTPTPQPTPQPTPTPTPQPTPTPTPQPTPSQKYLSSVVKTGDYVAYDAGNWNETSAETTTKKTDYSWGYKSGTSKNNGTKCRGSQDIGQAKNGWRVLGVSETEKKVILVHAGTPECYYHGASSASSAISNMDNRAKNYIDGKYADSAKIFRCDLLPNNCAQSTSYQDDLYNTGTHYYLGTAKTDGNSQTLWTISSRGRLTGNSTLSNGIRPVIILKKDVVVTGGNGTTSSPWTISR